MLIDTKGIHETMDLNNTTYFDEQLKLHSAYRISEFICEATKPCQQTLANKISSRIGKFTAFVPLPRKKKAEFTNHHLEFIAYNQLSSRVTYRNVATSKNDISDINSTLFKDSK